MKDGMMGSFYDIGRNTEYDARTENGMPAYSTTGEKVLDFFARAGGLRGRPDEFLNLFVNAYRDNRTLALKALFHARNIRGGMGERYNFRAALAWLCENDASAVLDNIDLIPLCGRWDDVFVLFDNRKTKRQAVAFYCDALKSGNSLAAKWAPREGKKLYRYAKMLMAYMRCSKKEYRKMLSELTRVVESLMSERQWGAIKYEQVPSRASMIYTRAFVRHDKDRYVTFLQQVKDGTKKIHSATLYPYEILRRADWINADALWLSLPEFVNPEISYLTMVDVSGSMFVRNFDPLPGIVAIGTGMYLSERAHGAFKNLLLTFSAEPEFFRIPDGSLKYKFDSIAGMNWGLNTDIGKALKLIVKFAVENKVRIYDMPTHLLILSDMQFDEEDMGSTEFARALFRQYGYEPPEIVYWNLGRYSNFPVSSNQNGVAIVSGFSPSAMQSIFANRSITPMQVMLETLEKYHVR